MSSSLESLQPQLALFEDARGPVRVERRYSEAVLAWALWQSHGNITQAARCITQAMRKLDPEAPQCSPTTIQKRLKASARLREIKRQAAESYIDNAEIVVQEVVEQPCVFCKVPLLRASQRFEICPARPDGFVDYDKMTTRFGSAVAYGLERFKDTGHICFMDHDPQERLNTAIGVCKTIGAARGWSQTGGRKFSIPLDVLNKLTLEEIEEAERRLDSGEDPETVFQRV